MTLASLHEQPWWTDADEAELDVLVRELVVAAFVHRERCSICRAGLQWCPFMVAALDIVLDWREGRVLHSKASWLRIRRTALEEMAA